jgi:RNA polymerase sigma-70 factor, ECF subfamily
MTIFANDRALLDRFRHGDRAALAAVYERYVDDVATLARRGFTIESSGHVYVRGAGRDGEYELVQETFARAFTEKARLAYDGLQPYRPYLLRITKNLMIDRFRAEQKDARAVALDAPSVGDIDQLLAANAEFPAVEEPLELDVKALFEAAAAYVASLPDEHRRFVTLRFEDELSQDDVAARLECTRRRVRTLERDVQDGLRTWLKSRGLWDR